MEKRYGLVTDYSGNVVPGSTITVTNYPAGTIASLFRDNAGTPENNPFVANDADGRYTFYAADGRYRIDIAPPLDANLSASSVIDVILSDTAYLQKASKAEVAALPLTQYDAGKKVFITSDDGGEFTIRHNATPGTYADNGGPFCGTVFIPIGGDGTIGIVRDNYESIQAAWFGIEPTASAATNNTGISNAITALASGGTLIFGFGIYEISSGFIVEKSNILLKGQGRGEFLFNNDPDARETAGTTLKWTGATGSGTMVKFTSDSADGGTEKKKAGGGMVDIFIDCQEKAAVGLEIQSWSKGNFRVMVGWAYTFGYKVHVLGTALASGSKDNQHNYFDFHYTEINTGQNPVGAIFGGDASGNTSFNEIKLAIWTDGTGNALELENTDSNIFLMARCGARSGSGGRVIFHADDTGQLTADTTCRANQFFAASFNDGLTVKATVAGTKNSRNNMIFGYVYENGATTPTVESGAHLIFADDHPAAIYSSQAALYRQLPINHEVKAAFRKRKAGDEIVNNSTTLQNDDTLFLNLDPGERYAFKATLLVSGDATADIKVAFTWPTGAAVRWGPENGIKVDTADAVVLERTYNVSGTAVSFGTGGATVRHIKLEGTILNGANPGNLHLQWAQNAAVVADTKVLTESYLEVTFL